MNIRKIMMPKAGYELGLLPKAFFTLTVKKLIIH